MELNGDWIQALSALFVIGSIIFAAIYSVASIKSGLKSQSSELKRLADEQHETLRYLRKTNDRVNKHDTRITLLEERTKIT